MKKKLDITEYAVEGMDTDEQRQFNHLNCPAGRDTKRRLYIKKVSNGHVYYCHHCGSHGLLIESLAYYKSHVSRSAHHSTGTGSHVKGSKEPVFCSTTGKYTLPRDHVSDIREWPIEAKLWIRRYGIADGEVLEHVISYSPRFRRVVLPVFGSTGLDMYQLRKIYDDDSDKRKYITYRNSGSGGCLKRAAVKSNTICIVEDYLSAIKVSRHVDAYALLGSHISTVGLTKVIDGKYDRAFIWLDDDNRQIKRAQIVLKNLLEIFIKEVHIVHTSGADPKEHDDAGISRILKL